MGWWRKLVRPNAGSRPPISPADAERAADYAIRVAESYTDNIPGGRAALRGRRFLEFGPGSHFGSMLVLAAWGARDVCAVDRFLPSFDERSHPLVYERLAALLQARADGADTDPIRRYLERPRERESIVRGLRIPLEELRPEAHGTFDYTASNAVFEHLYHPLRAFRALHAITAPGGCGVHQVDFRWHWDFDRPLEYLLLDEFSFADELTASDGECGNRVRPHQMEAMFRAAGFTDVVFQANLQVDEAYLRDFLPRLREAHASPYATMPDALLRTIGGRFIVRRPAT